MRLHLICIALLAPIAAAAQADASPADVAAYVRERELCDHWRGEEPYDAARAEEINTGACLACNGTDARLAKLKSKYRKNKQVSAALAQFDATAEAKAQPGKPNPCTEILEKHGKVVK